MDGTEVARNAEMYARDAEIFLNATRMVDMAKMKVEAELSSIFSYLLFRVTLINRYRY